MNCPHCSTPIDLKAIPEPEFASERGRRLQARRKSFPGGPGRPACPCGHCPVCIRRIKRLSRAKNKSQQLP